MWISLKKTHIWSVSVSTCWSRRRRGSSSLPFGRLHGHTPDKGVVYTHQDVLRFDVRVDDFTFRVEVVQTLQDLKKKNQEIDTIRKTFSHEYKQNILMQIPLHLSPLRAKWAILLILVILWELLYFRFKCFALLFLSRGLEWSREGPVHL